MFEKNYYCLVAGLREYALDSEIKGFDAVEIISQIKEELSAKDLKSLALLQCYYDCENIIALRHSRSAFNPLGNLSREELEAEMEQPRLLPKRIAEVIRAYAEVEDEEADEESKMDLSLGFERSLMKAYYEECSHSSCRFLREWSEFDRTLRNVVAAIVARSLDRSIESVTVGAGNVVEQLHRSSASDFGLRGEIEYLDSVITAVSDVQNMVEKEHKIDLIRWEQALQIAFTDYFNINAILSYVARINIVARWTLLDEKRGREMFERIKQEFDGKNHVNK